MLSSLLVLSTAFAAGDPDAEGDVVASIQIAAAPDVVHAYLMDLSNHADLAEKDCTRKWQLGERTDGVGAGARLTYVAPPVWRRSLTMTIIESEPRRITIDHPGNRGFVTTFDFEDPEAADTNVTMHTWINPPPKPLQGVYFKWVQPHWRDCQERFLASVAAAVAG